MDPIPRPHPRPRNDNPVYGIGMEDATDRRDPGSEGMHESVYTGFLLCNVRE